MPRTEDLEEDIGSDEEGEVEPGGKRRIKRWTATEHELLVKLVEQLGEDACWATIAQHIPGRSGKQCRERWVNHIGADIKKGGWTPDEEAQVARLHATIGPAWTRIANALGGRTENSVKNHFNALLRSKRLEDKRTSVLAQYVRIMRDKLATGLAAYEKAVHQAQNAISTASQETSSQPTSKSRGNRSSQQGSHASGADGRSTGRPGMQPIRTRMQSSPGNPSFNSAGLAGIATAVTPMSGAGMGDATVALAAAVKAVQDATQALAGVGVAVPTGAPLGDGQFSGGVAGAASEGLTDSLQYSGGSPGVLGSRGGAPAQSASMSVSVGEDGVVRGMRRTGRGGRGRPGYGHMPTLRDARSGGTPTTKTPSGMGEGEDGSMWQVADANEACASGASHQIQPSLPPLGTSAPFTPVSGRTARVKANNNAAQNNGWMSNLGAPANMLLAHAQQGYDGMGMTGSPMSGNQYGTMQDHGSIPTVQLTPSLQEQMAQLTQMAEMSAGLLVRPGDVHNSGHGMSSGLQSNGDGVHTLGGGMLLHHNSWGTLLSPMKGQMSMPMHMLPARFTGDGGPAPLQQQQQQGKNHHHNTRVRGGPGTRGGDAHGDNNNNNNNLALVDPNAAGASANSLTLGMHDLIGNSVFGYQQGVDIGSPMSPASRQMQGRLSGPLGAPLFSQFPSAASYDILTSVPDSQEPLLGRLSGLSLDQMLASPMSARTPSASALYFLQGARTSRGDGLLSASQVVSHPQLLLSPFHHQDKMDRSNTSSLPTPKLLDGPNNGPSAQAPRPGAPMGGIADDLGLVMKPLHVKTRRGQAGDAAATPTDGAGTASMLMMPPSSKLPVVANNATGGATITVSPRISGMQLMADGTPTARMLGEVWLTWTQEPCTPSNLLMGSPAYPIMQLSQVLQGPLLSNHQIGLGGGGGGGGGGADGMFSPSASFMRLQSEDAATPRDNLMPQISVPAPEDMECLHIVFDDSAPADAPPQPLQPLQTDTAEPGGELIKSEAQVAEVEAAAGAGGGGQGEQPHGAPPSPSDVVITPRLSAGGTNGAPTPSLIPATKRGSAAVWGDVYTSAGGHSAPKRVAVQLTPGAMQQDGGGGPGMQHSAESSGTPVAVAVLPSSPMGEAALGTRNSLAWAGTQNRRPSSSSQQPLAMPMSQYIASGGGGGAAGRMARTSKPQLEAAVVAAVGVRDVDETMVPGVGPIAQPRQEQVLFTA